MPLATFLFCVLFAGAAASSAMFLQAGQLKPETPLTLEMPPFIKLVKRFGSNVTSTKGGVNVSLGEGEQCTCTFSAEAENACACGRIMDFLGCVKSACASGSGCNCFETQEVNACREVEGVCSYVPLQCDAESGPKCMVDEYTGAARDCKMPWCKARSANSGSSKLTPLPPGPEAIAKAAGVMQCVEETERWLALLKPKSKALGLPATLTLQCSSSLVWKELGGSHEKCHELALGLAEAYETSGQYFAWCRTVSLAGSDILAKAEIALKSDPAVKGLVDQCQSDCPFLTKMVTNAAKVSKIQTLLFSPPGEGEKPKTPEDYKQGFASMSTLNTQICDFHAQAKCQPSNMPKACTDLLTALALPAPMLEAHFTRCDTRKPCFAVCPGVDAKNEAHGLAAVEMYSHQWPFPRIEDTEKNCKALSAMEACHSKTQCKPYLNTLFVTEESLASSRKACDYYQNDCYSKDFSKCGSAVKAINDINRLNFTYCPMLLTGNPYAGDAALMEPCCNKLTELADCEAKQGCPRFTFEQLTEESNRKSIKDACASWGASK